MTRRRGERGAVGAVVVAAGTVACLALGFLVAVFLPITDTGEAAGAPRAYDQAALNGRALYVREGCVLCHTQGVRDTFGDGGLGPAPSEPGLYDNEAPNLIGTIRLGPDLTCFGDREKDAQTIVRHLRNPAAVHEGSAMPRYGYLSAKELQALASYLLKLNCGEG